MEEYTSAVMAGIRPIISGGRLLTLLCLLLLTGCSKADPKWIGTWTGNIKLKPLPGQNETMINTLGKVEVTIHPDRTFDLFESGLPKAGTVSYSNGKAYLKIETLMGKPIEGEGDAAVKMNHDITLTLLDDNTLQYVDPGSPRRDPDGTMPEPLKLERKTQPAQTG
jgi:hypothetical protein